MAPRLLSCFGKSHNNNNHPRSSNTAVATSDTIDTTTPTNNTGSIIVELFSSQGCVTSSEAELLISRLGRGDFNLNMKVIVLVFHVDYWDYNGWKDLYGSSQWTVRQKSYVEALKLDTIFTPQVVVQGVVQCVGNEEDGILNAIASAPKYPSPTFQANFQKTSPDTLQVTLTGALRMKLENQEANIIVALYENGLVTNCTNGANKERVLSNDYVVRKLEKLCSIKDITAKKTVTGTVSFQLWDGFNSSKCGVAVFVQDSSYHIFGSQNFELPQNL